MLHQQYYAKKRDAIIRISEKHLTGLAEWFAPAAGNNSPNYSQGWHMITVYFHIIRNVPLV
jgi:hypothetical protein